jgi:catechol 2,3-dioxygenase-like lactoylglutathione lyase family enzyme
VPFWYAGIRVTDLRRSLRFYTEVLGLREAIRGDHRSVGMGIWVGLEDPKTHQRLELNWYPPGSRYAVRYRSGEALDHLGFLLGNVPRSRLEAEYARLLRSGAKPTAVTPAVTDGWMFQVRDPDGNWVEVFRRPTPAEARRETQLARKRRARSD